MFLCFVGGNKKEKKKTNFMGQIFSCRRHFENFGCFGAEKTTDLGKEYTCTLFSACGRKK